MPMPQRIFAAKVLKNIAPETDIEVIEEHFRQKQEVSGTAKKIADILDVPEDTWAVCLLVERGYVARYGDGCCFSTDEFT